MYKSFFLFLFIYCNSQAQQNFTKQDSLRGSITTSREWWDVVKYSLDIRVYPKIKKISGSNTITYKVVKNHNLFQFELQAPLVIDSITQDNSSLSFKKKGISYFVNITKPQIKDTLEKIVIYYHGKPKEAIDPPWNGGIVWSKDSYGNHFIANANQSVGASIWWPCKDHPADEVESMKITVTCPENYTNVSNGTCTKIIKNKNKTSSYTWEVNNPINAYGVSINIAKYYQINEIHKGIKGNLDCNYYVLAPNFLKAKSHFKDVTKTLEALEYWLGPYPFYNDGYKLVEVPYLGMEHQSCIGYGNQYKKGYLGTRIGNSPWALKFDYIIVHETGHEWFANSITCKDIADLWIHESFTTYAESLFIDYHYGTQAANEYVQGLASLVKNDKPIIGNHNVHNEGSIDMYFKGSLALHTLRQIVNNDSKWKNILKELNVKFYHKTTSGTEVINFLNNQIDLNINGFFYQYFNTIQIPSLKFKQQKNVTLYKWENVIDNFEMPIKIYLNNKAIWISPKVKHWQKIEGDSKLIKVDPNFYITHNLD